DPGVDAQSPSRVRVPTTHRQQCGTRARRQPCGPGGKPRGCPEEVDLHARRGQCAISDEAHRTVAAESAEQRSIRARPGSVPNDLETERLPVGDEPSIQRLRFESFRNRTERADMSDGPDAG